jgi:hypothetical protein
MVVDMLTALGVTYRDISFKPTGMRPDQDFHALSAFITLFRKTRPDILLGYTIKPVIYGLIAARVTRVPQRFAMITGLGYAFISDGLKAQLAGAAARQLYRMSLAGADRVFFQNPDDQIFHTSVHDEIVYEEGEFSRRTNRAGGTEGGVSTGMPLVVRGYMKPIPTLIKPLDSVDIESKEAQPTRYERSDVTSVPAASTVAEATVAFDGGLPAKATVVHAHGGEDTRVASKER